jgi:hypothetical protein
MCSLARLAFKRGPPRDAAIVVGKVRTWDKTDFEAVILFRLIELEKKRTVPKVSQSYFSALPLQCVITGERGSIPALHAASGECSTTAWVSSALLVHLTHACRLRSVR